MPIPDRPLAPRQSIMTTRETPPVEGIPYVPGVVRGVLCRDRHKLVAGKLCILSQRDILEVVGTRGAGDALLAEQLRGVGILAVGGAPLSHPMIRLLGLGVPTVIVSAAQLSGLTEGVELVLDGATGRVAGSAQGAPAARASEPPVPRAGSPVLTADGVEVRLNASVAGVRGAANAVAQGAAAIGLIRSEYLLPADDIPSRADDFESLLETLCTAAQPLALTLRLLDVAAGKLPAWRARLAGSEGPLGLRGTQLYATEPVRSVYRAQVQAVGRLAGRFALSLLLPNVSGPAEFRRWRTEIEQLLPRPVPIGAMAETPAAALALGETLKIADFVALGCNDLMQCFFGVDRDIPEVSEFLDPCAPALFCFLRQVAEAAGEAVGEVQLCGLLPQSPGILPVLLGLGYRRFSVEPVVIPYLARTIGAVRMGSAEALAAAVCAAPDAEGVRLVLGLPRGSAWGIGAQALPPAPAP